MSTPAVSRRGVAGMLARAAAQPVDPRFAPVVGDKRRRGREAVRDYLDGTVLAEHWNGDFGAAITHSGDKVALRTGWEPAGAGFWMDFPEKEWGLSAAAYARLPMAERAALEAREQATRYIPEQFGYDWLDTYHPELADAQWWGGGSRLAMHDHGAWMRSLTALAERVRSGGRSRRRRSSVVSHAAALRARRRR